MAVITPAIGIQSGSHSAKAFRQLAACLAGAAVQTFANSVGAVDVGHGLVRPTHLAVVQNGTPNMSVNVGAGSCLINGSSTLAQAVYAVTNDATVNLAIAAANPTNPRRDIVVMQIRDNTEDAGGSNDARLFVVTGTPAASPVDPAIPAGTLAIARVAVAALATTITNANITAVAGLARGSNWNLPWGLIAEVKTSAVQTVGTGGTDLTTLTTTITAIAGRKYAATACVHARQRTSAGLVSLFVIAASSTIGGGRFSVGTDEYCSFAAPSQTFQGAGSVIVKLQGQTSANTVDFNGGVAESTLQVFDVGPA